MRRIAAPRTVVRFVVTARVACAILLLLGLPIVLFAPSAGRWDSVYGTMFYMLAVGEYVHYLFFKVNMRPRELRSALSGRTWPRARLARELHRARARLARSASAQRNHRADGAR